MSPPYREEVRREDEEDPDHPVRPVQGRYHLSVPVHSVGITRSCGVRGRKSTDDVGNPVSFNVPTRVEVSGPCQGTEEHPPRRSKCVVSHTCVPPDLLTSVILFVRGPGRR